MYLRDNCRDGTDLSPLFVENVYRVIRVAYPCDVPDVGANSIYLSDGSSHIPRSRAFTGSSR